jgi:hypothetical protein
VKRYAEKAVDPPRPATAAQAAGGVPSCAVSKVENEALDAVGRRLPEDGSQLGQWQRTPAFVPRALRACARFS